MDGIQDDIKDLGVDIGLIDNSNSETAPPVDDVYLAAEQDKVDKTLFATLKQVFIIVKSAFTIYICLHAAYKWRKTKLPMGKPAQFLLIFNALIVLGVGAYKFTTKQIAPLFLLQAASHYSCFCVLHVLLGYVDVKNKEKRDKLVSIFKPFHFMFAIVAYIGYKSSSCDQKNFYPDSFILSNSLFLGVYIMAYSLHKSNYRLEWGPDEEKTKKLFEAQTERFMSCYTFLIEWHIFELVLAKILDVFTDSIHCSADGKSWFYSSGKGNLFMMLHLVGTGIGAAMARAVFIKTAKKSGLFDDLEDDDEDEDDPKKVKEEAKESKKTQ